MNRRTFLGAGLVMGASPGSVETRPEGRPPSEQRSPRASRRIADEAFGNSDYDAIWYLVNVGFLIRLQGSFILLDPIFSGDNPEYIQTREKYQATGRPQVEVKHYDLEQIYTQPSHFPLRADEVKKADVVLLTHEHTDHCDPREIQKIAHLKPKIIASKACHKDLLKQGVAAELLVEASYGSAFDFENFSIEIQYSDHSPGACGFLIKTPYGNIYHPGDNRFDHERKNEMCNLDVDYLLLPINDTNFGVGFAALLTQILQPRVVIPCHFGFFYPPVRSQGGHPAEYVTAIAARNYHIPNTDIVILKPGGKYVLV